MFYITSVTLHLFERLETKRFSNMKTSSLHKAEIDCAICVNTGHALLAVDSIVQVANLTVDAI